MLQTLQGLESILRFLKLIFHLAVERLADFHVLQALDFEAVLEDFLCECMLLWVTLIFKQFNSFCNERDAFCYVFQAGICRLSYFYVGLGEFN